MCALTKSSFPPSLLVRSFCKSPSSRSLPAFDTLGLSTGALCRMLLYISAVLRLQNGGCFKKKKGVVLILYKQSGDLKRHKVTGFHLQVHRAFHRAPIPGTTSRQCGHTPASGEPQEPNTEKKNREKFNASPTLFLRSRTEVILMMNKCLKMYLLPQASHRRLSWYRWAQGLLCRGQSLLGQCVPVSLAGCSLASGPCQKQDKEMFTLNASGHRFTDVHQGELWHHSLPVHYVQRVEVAKCTCNFSSVEPGSGLQEDSLSLEMVEQLEQKKANICQHLFQTRLYILSSFCRTVAYLSTVDVVQHKVQLVSSLEGVVQPHQEGMLDVLHQHTALSHDMLLLEERRWIITCRFHCISHYQPRENRQRRGPTSFFFRMIFFCNTLTAQYLVVSLCRASKTCLPSNICISNVVAEMTYMCGGEQLHKRLHARTDSPFQSCLFQ